MRGRGRLPPDRTKGREAAQTSMSRANAVMAISAPMMSKRSMEVISSVGAFFLRAKSEGFQLDGLEIDADTDMVGVTRGSCRRMSSPGGAGV